MKTAIAVLFVAATSSFAAAQDFQSAKVPGSGPAETERFLRQYVAPEASQQAAIGALPGARGDCQGRAAGDSIQVTTAAGRVVATCQAGADGVVYAVPSRFAGH